jgi:hypothetical protein
MDKIFKEVVDVIPTTVAKPTEIIKAMKIALEINKMDSEANHNRQIGGDVGINRQIAVCAIKELEIIDPPHCTGLVKEEIAKVNDYLGYDIQKDTLYVHQCKTSKGVPYNQDRIKEKYLADPKFCLVMLRLMFRLNINTYSSKDNLLEWVMDSVGHGILDYASNPTIMKLVKVPQKRKTKKTGDV